MRARALAPLLLLLLAAPAAASPASQPASAPASSPAPASGEIIDDAADPGGAVAPRPALAPAGASEPATIARAGAALRLGLDPVHERSGPATAGPYHEDVLELLGTASAHLDHRLRPGLRLELGGRLLYRLTSRRGASGTYTVFNGTVHRSDLEADLLDSALTFATPHVALQAGMVTAVLGATDLVNPNDVLTVRDLRSGMFLDPAASRLPVPLVRAEAQVRGVGLAAYFMPVFRPHRVDVFGSDFALFGPIAPVPLQQLGTTLDELVDPTVAGAAQDAVRQSRLPRPFSAPDVAARVRRVFGGWDVALQYAWLHERLPVLRVSRTFLAGALPLLASGAALAPETRAELLGRLLAQSPLPIEGVYRRQHQAGLSVAGALGPLRVAFDAAYLSREAANLGGAFPFAPDGGDWLAASVDSQSVATTLGLTYVRGADLVVGVEAWYKVLVDLALEAAATRPPLLLGGPHFGGLAAHASWTVPGTHLTLRLVGQGDVVNRALVLLPQAVYRRGDHLGFVAGAMIFDGAAASLGGRLTRNDQVYVGVEGAL
ncbi:MAG TPA: hypothetical protein VGQ83_32975 [Polyangia bacterium]